MEILGALWVGGALFIGNILKKHTPIDNDSIPWVLAILGGVTGWGISAIPGAIDIGFFKGVALAMAASPVQKVAQAITSKDGK